jgi:hypothetical protein
LGTERKVSVSLDEDLVSELEAGDEALSAQVNDAVRLELDRWRRLRLLGEMLGDLDETHGPVDEKIVQKYLGCWRGRHGRDGRRCDPHR